MAALPERVLRAKVHIELEPTDFSLKRMLQAHPGTFLKPQDMFIYLRNMREPFWADLPGAVSLIHEWAQYLRVPDSLDDLKCQIWENFLCRLSLDARLITGKTAAESHGNEVLRIMMDTVETTLLSRLSIHHMMAPAAEMQQQQQQQQHTMDTLSLSSTFPASVSALYGHGPRALADSSPISVTERHELAELQRTMRHMALPPPADRRGMPVTLRRSQDKFDYRQAEPRHTKQKTKTKKHEKAKAAKAARPHERPSHKGSRSRKQMELLRASTSRGDELDHHKSSDSDDRGEEDEEEEESEDESDQEKN